MISQADLGLLDGFEPATLPAALQTMMAGLGQEPLTLDMPRDDWLARLKNWLGRAP